MSVASIQLPTFANVATTLKFCNDLKYAFYSFREKYLKLMYKKQADPEPDENEILCFIERLYIANRLAYLYQYPDECKNNSITIKRLEKEQLNGFILPISKLLEELKHIEYNIYTNAGRCFLGNEDMERLHRLMDACKMFMLQTQEVQ